MHQRIKTFALFLFIFSTFLQASTAFQAQGPDSTHDNQRFRDAIVSYVRAVANHSILKTKLISNPFNEWEDRYQGSRWSVQVTIFNRGQPIGQGSSQDDRLQEVIRKATEEALSHSNLKPITATDLANFRFEVDFSYYPKQYYSFIEYAGKGLELSGSRVAIRSLDNQLLLKQIQNSQQYLLRMMHPTLHGFAKHYDAELDKTDPVLRTIYSASSLYTLLKLYEFNHDEQLEQQFRPIAQFLLFMQIDTGPNAGGFYYSYNLKSKKKSCRAVVGTASKTIFTLLELHRFYHDEQYLLAAEKAGDWLLSMIKEDGQVTAVATCKANIWQYNQNQSYLYSGQVLSALSRLYAATKEARYYQGASKIAQRFSIEAKKQHLFVGDDYRPKNSISTSWLLMSMIDYAQINEQPQYIELIKQLAAVILSMQITDRHDVYLFGRYRDTRKASGNGWITEVMGNVYEFCKNKHLTHCASYRKAMILSARWLIQNSYSPANSYDIRNPSHAIGGFISFFPNKLIRTDAVCHGINGLLTLVKAIGSPHQPFLNVPERPLADILPSLRAGSGLPS